MRQSLLILILIYVFDYGFSLDNDSSYELATFVEFNSIDFETGIIDIYMTNNDPVGGFQISLSGVEILSILEGSSSQNGLTISYSSNTVLGYSLTEETIPPGAASLLELHVSFQTDQVCLTEVILSNSTGQGYDVNVGDCVVCEGQNSDCLGCSDLDADNYNEGAIIDDGSCLFAHQYLLHSGNNLVSFLTLPNNPSIQNVLESIEGNATQIISEGVAAVFSEIHGEWLGSLSEINLLSGYWINLINDDQLTIISSYPPENSELSYSLHQGSNLISFPFIGSHDINNIFPSNIVHSISGVIGESVASINIEGEFFGSLSELSGEKGYWVHALEPIIFQFQQP